MSTETKTLFTKTRHYNGVPDLKQIRTWFFFALFAAVMSLVGVGIGVIAYHVDSAACLRTGDRLERAVEYDFWGDGCFVETDEGRFVPLSAFRITNEEAR